MKRLMLSALITALLITPTYADQNSDALKAYGILTQSQVSTSVMNSNITRNEFYVIIGGLYKNTSAVNGTLTFNDLIPNSDFTYTAKKMDGLKLLLEDQKKGKFEPAKNMTYEEVCQVVLKMLDIPIKDNSVLITAYNAGLLENIKIKTTNQLIERTYLYSILNKALETKHSSGVLLKEKLKLVDSSKPNQGQSPIETNSVPEKLEGYTKNSVVLTYTGIPSEKKLQELILRNEKDIPYTVTARKQIADNVYLVSVAETLGKGSLMKIEGSSVTAKLEYAENSELYCMSEQSLSLHSRSVKLKFNQKLDYQSALALQNYTPSTGLKLESVSFDQKEDGTLDFQTVVLKTSEQSPAKLYSIRVANIKGANGSTLTATAFNDIKFYGANYDIYPPKVGQITAEAINKIRINFTEASGLSKVEAEQVQNYNLYEINTKKTYKVIKAELLKSKDSDVYGSVLLEVEPLARLNTYMLEVKDLKDVAGNTISKETEYRGSVTLSDREETPAKLTTVESLSRNLLKLIFDKEVQLSGDFTLENVRLSNEVKATKVAVDEKQKNTVWVTTTDQQRSGVSLIRIENLYDNFGNRTGFGHASQNFATLVSDLNAPVIGLVENNIGDGKNIIKLHFTQAMDKGSIEDVSQYKIEGLKILYAYQVTDHQVNLVTVPQKKGQVYQLNIGAIVDTFGTPLSSSSKTKAFIGVDPTE